MPRSKQDFKAITDERKQSILDSALRLFSLYGYDSISIDDITKASKCSHGLFYHYFSSKADLFHTLMELIHSKWEKEIEKLNLNQPPLSIIKDITNFYIEKLKQEDEDAYVLYLFLTFHLQKNLPEPLHKKDKDKKGPFKKIVEIVKQGQEDGVFEVGDPIEYVRAYFACLEGLAYNRIYLGKNVFKNIDAKIIINMLLKKEVHHA